MELVRSQVFEPQAILPPADDVFAERQPISVRRNFHAADLVILVRGGELVGVEQNLLGRIEFPAPARVDRVFLAGLEARVIPVSVLVPWDGRVVLLQTGDDFGEERLLERFGACAALLAIGVFRSEVGQCLGVAPLVIPQPVVRIRPVTVSGFHDMRAHRRDRRQDDIAIDDARHLGIMRSYIRRAYLRMPLKHAGAIASI